MALVSYTGATTKSYISSINFLDQRDILNEVFDVTAEDSTILDIMELTGKMIVTDVPLYNAFVDDYLFQVATVASVDATRNGSVADSPKGTVNASNLLLTLNAQTDLTNSSNTTYNLPLVNELVMLPNKQIGRVTSSGGSGTGTGGATTSASQIIVEPINTTDVLNTGATLAAGNPLIFFSDAQGEGDPDPQGRRPRFYRTANTVQIFKTANSVTDLQKVSTIEVQYGGKNYVMYKLQHDTLRQHRMKIAYQLLVGKTAQYSDVNTGNTVYMTQGLRQYIQNGDGTTYTVGGVSVPLSGAVVTQAKVRAMMRALDKRQAPKEYMGWFGGALRADFHELAQGLNAFNNGGIVYNQFGDGDAKQRALDLGIDSLRIYNRTLHLKTVDAYDHPNLFGLNSTAAQQAQGGGWDGEGYFIPSGKIKTDEGGQTWDYLTVRYMAGDGTDLRYLEAVTGKLAPNGATDGTAVLRFSYESVMGLQAIGTRLFGIFTG